MYANKLKILFSCYSKKREVIMKIQTVCAFLILGSVLNVSAYAAEKTDYLQLKSVETGVEADTAKKRLNWKLRQKEIYQWMASLVLLAMRP